MQVLKTVSSIKRFLKNAFHPIVLVPTMGALHEGHVALIKRGRKLAGKKGTLVVSIFLNPTQFALGEDLAKYPQRQKEDLALCKENGVDAVFMPSAKEMYTENHSVFVDETRLAHGLCGQSRPGHFRGVCTVVAKLFHICSPDIAVFGQKDWQQLAIIRQMVRNLNFPVRIIDHQTIRESSGLALSSRNAYLSEEQRRCAGLIHASLCSVKKQFRKGEHSGKKLRKLLHDSLNQIPSVDIDYAEIVDPHSLEPLQRVDRVALAILAVKIGTTRLIDNMLLK